MLQAWKDKLIYSSLSMITSYIQVEKLCVLSLTLTEKVDWRGRGCFWCGLCIFTPHVLYFVLSSYSNAVFEKELL